MPPGWSNDPGDPAAGPETGREHDGKKAKHVNAELVRFYCKAAQTLHIKIVGE